MFAARNSGSTHPHVFSGVSGPAQVMRSPAEVSQRWVPPTLSGLGTSSGVDVIVGSEAMQTALPWVADTVVGGLHARRCGWVDSQQMGLYMLKKAKAAGVRVVSGQCPLLCHC